MATTSSIATQAPSQSGREPALLVYLFLGVAFGIVLTKSQVLSWFRIQEMFRFQSFRMYGIIGTAIATAAVSVALIKKARLRAVSGEIISIPARRLGHGIRYAAGGTIFGLGWALTGACPGRPFALAANGFSVLFAAIFTALVAPGISGLLRPRLPH